MTYEATEPCVISVTYGDGHKTQEKVGRGFRLNSVAVHEASVSGIWAGDPKSAVSVRLNHFQATFQKVE